MERTKHHNTYLASIGEVHEDSMILPYCWTVQIISTRPAAEQDRKLAKASEVCGKAIAHGSYRIEEHCDVLFFWFAFRWCTVF